ncbi:Orn/Lys/Arg family decarboxylase [Rhodococcus triatomae]|nr:orn/lys/arg decarboxylase [Rhodococcus triatomae BKS 15-14]
MGRIAAEQLTPYPPGIPAVVPGERLDGEVLDYLRSGLHAGMAVPDASESRLERVRVVALRVKALERILLPALIEPPSVVRFASVTGRVAAQGQREER